MNKPYTFIPVLLWCVASCGATTPIDRLFTDVPADAERVTVVKGAKRLSNQTHIFTTVPDPLEGLPAIAPHRGPSTSKPGPGYEIRLTRPAALYLAVHHRGKPTVPAEWKPTGLTLGWGGHEDDIYVRIAEPGTVSIRSHDGQAGGFGVPHMVIASRDLERARRLIENPVKRRSAIYRPARVIAVLADPDQPGLYGHPGDRLSWKLRVIPGSEGTLPDRLKVDVQELEGDFAWSTGVPVDRNGHTELLSLTPPRIGFYDIRVDTGDDYDLAAFRGGLGVVPQPGPVDRGSPWGVMRVAEAPFEAPLARMLGAAWVRHTNWNMVEPTQEGVNATRFRRIAEQYHDQGLHIMASISMVPRAMSSRPDDASQSGDAGPMHARVRPRDWNQWQAFMRETAAATRDLIDYWEIGNEPNTPHHYWAGSVEEFADLVKHAAAGIRQANPDAVILTSGFTLNPSARTYLDRLLDLGVGSSFDILTVHSLYAKAVTVDEMRQVLGRHNLDPNMAVWSTEPKHVLPIRNFEAGVRKNMHFMLVNPGAYGAFQNLAERDGAATRWGVAYAIASKTLGDAAYERTIPTGLPDVELGLFRRDREKLLAAAADEGPRGAGIRLRVTAEDGKLPIYTDLLGHGLDMPANGEFIMPLDRSGILHGASDIQILEVAVDVDAKDRGLIVTADKARLANGFVMRSGEDREHYAAVYQPADSARPRLTFPFKLSEGGTYEFYVSAKWFPSHAGVLVSPFSWSVDGKAPATAQGATTMHWRRSTRSHLRFGVIDASRIETVPSSQILAKLGVVRNLQGGEHTLTLELQKPRTHDQHYSMEVELIAARPITDDRE